MKSFLLIITLLISYSGFGQAGIVINNNVNMVMNSGVYIVVDNAASSAVATAGTGGNIISEAENNIIKWNIGTSTGNYIIPFTTASGIKIPLSVNITSPGTGTGNIEFSTYNGPTWNNDTYRPTGVTNMTNMGVTNNSSEVIDRFWIIDANGYTVMPSGDIKFNYDDAEHLAAGNTITESDLKAERYEDAADDWEIFPVGGIVNTVSNDVSGVPFSSTDFMRTWTLIDQTTHILPIVLLSFEATCFSSDAVISWQTAQEINTDHFILESSINGENFTTLASINAAGNSNTERSYSFIIKNYTETYYRLKLVNTDASVEDLGVVSVNCSSTTPYTINAYASGIRQITLQTFGLKKGIYYLECFDIAGKEILHNEIYVDEYFNEFIVKEDLLAEGIYILRLNAQDAGAPFTYAKKIPILF